MRPTEHGGSEAMLKTFSHQIAHHLARDAAAGRQPSHHLAVAAVEAEQHLDRLAVPAADSEDVRAPAQVLERYHHAIVAALAPASVTRQQQLIDPHDAVDALVVDS